jgi:hypothetical protein
VAKSTGLLLAVTASVGATTAAANAGDGVEGEGEEEEGEEGEGVEQGSLNSVSATTFPLPVMCLISDTNSAMKANCHYCQ